MGDDVTRLASAIDSHVGKRVRRRRIELGMSQKALSEVIGVSYQQVQKYERGANRIGAGVLWILSKALDVEPSYFFGELGPEAGIGAGASRLSVKAARANDRETPSDRETMELIKAYKTIPDDQVRKGIRQMIGAVAKTTESPRLRRGRLS